MKAYKCDHCGEFFEVVALPKFNPPCGYIRRADGQAIGYFDWKETERTGDICKRCFSVAARETLASWNAYLTNAERE